MASLPAAAAAVKFVESWEFSIFYNLVIFGPICLFTAFLEISKRALSFWKHSRPHFTMTNGPKRHQKLAAAPSVVVPLYNTETTFFDQMGIIIALY